eukprot:scaffold421282_cov56-Attheya_sp.AAC.2
MIGPFAGGQGESDGTDNVLIGLVDINEFLAKAEITLCRRLIGRNAGMRYNVKSRGLYLPTTRALGHIFQFVRVLKAHERILTDFPPRRMVQLNNALSGGIGRHIDLHLETSATQAKKVLHETCKIGTLQQHSQQTCPIFGLSLDSHRATTPSTLTMMTIRSLETIYWDRLGCDDR